MTTKTDISDNHREEEAIDGAPEPLEFLDWGQLGIVATKTVYIEKFGGYVTYRTSIPFDRMADIQARNPGMTRQAVETRTLEILRYAMIRPRITDENIHAVRKADAGLLFELANEIASGGKREDKDNTPEH